MSTFDERYAETRTRAATGGEAELFAQDHTGYFPSGPGRNVSGTA